MFRQILQNGFQVAIHTVLLSSAAFAQTAVRTENVTAPDLNTILTRMKEARAESRMRIRAYSVIREYRLYEDKAENPKTKLKAKIQFLPPRTKQYDVLDSTGGIGEKVVRRILDHEMALTRDPVNAEMSDANYEFRFLDMQQWNGRNCYVLETHPRRNDKNLIQAQIWVDANSFRIVHLEGAPLKDPSFWIRDVHLRLDFAEVNGMWLQTETQATARVRWIGVFNLIGRDQNYQIDDASIGVMASGGSNDAVTAKIRSGSPSRHTKSAMLAGAGVTH